jgi:hypothetical protein
MGHVLAIAWDGAVMTSRPRERRRRPSLADNCYCAGRLLNCVFIGRIAVRRGVFVGRQSHDATASWLTTSSVGQLNEFNYIGTRCNWNEGSHGSFLSEVLFRR